MTADLDVTQAFARQRSEPVTVVATREVEAGREVEYEAWLERLIASASKMPGYAGTNVIRPGPTGPRTYTSIFRFDSVDSLRAFEESDLRRRALLEVAPLVKSDAMWKKLTGLELWFTPPPGTVVPEPSRFRMAILLTLVVFGLVLSIGQLVGAALAALPRVAQLFVTIVIEVFFMTYVLMPRLTRWLARFIYPAPKRSGRD